MLVRNEEANSEHGTKRAGWRLTENLRATGILLGTWRLESGPTDRMLPCYTENLVLTLEGESWKESGLF